MDLLRYADMMQGEYDDESDEDKLIDQLEKKMVNQEPTKDAAEPI